MKKGLVIISIESLIKENFRLKILSGRNFSDDIIEKKMKGKYIRKKDIIYDKPYKFASAYVKQFYLQGYQIAYFTTNSSKMIEHYKKWLELYNFPRMHCLENPIEDNNDAGNKKEIYERIIKDFGEKYKDNIYLIDTYDWRDWWKNSYKEIKFIKSDFFKDKKFILKKIEYIYNNIDKNKLSSFIRIPKKLINIPLMLIRKPIILMKKKLGNETN